MGHIDTSSVGAFIASATIFAVLFLCVLIIGGLLLLSIGVITRETYHIALSLFQPTNSSETTTTTTPTMNMNEKPDPQHPITLFNREWSPPVFLLFSMVCWPSVIVGLGKMVELYDFLLMGAVDLEIVSLLVHYSSWGMVGVQAGLLVVWVGRMVMLRRSGKIGRYNGKEQMRVVGKGYTDLPVVK